MDYVLIAWIAGAIGMVLGWCARVLVEEARRGPPPNNHAST